MGVDRPQDHAAGVFSAVAVFWDSLSGVVTVLAGTIISLFPAAIAARIRPADAIAL